jgi:flagellar hook-associated protein 2
MARLSSSIGLISGINFVDIVDQLIALERRPIVRLEQRARTFLAEESALKTLEANLLTLTTAIQTLNKTSVFKAFSVSNSDTASISVTTNDNVIPAEFQFQAIREADTHLVRSRGFADSSQQTLGAGTISIITGGELNSSTKLDALNGGNGIQRGTIRITDRTGAEADIDLSNVFTVDDVLNAINADDTVSVLATAQGGRLVVTDVSGGSASDLIVADVNNGQTAEDLGIAASVAGNVLTGSEVYVLTAGFALDQLNDGNAVQFFKDAADISITLTDDTVIEVNLDGATTLAQVIDNINNHADNNGKVSAALVNGRLELDDLSGGGGTSTFSIANINNAAVVRQIGLDTTAAGTKITGRRLLAGINSVLLANLRGGQGIDQTGQIGLTDRSGVSATIDLSAAESLDEVVDAINSATSSGGTKLQLTARINDSGTGIIVVDTSGATTSNLIIADVGGSTLATQLGISVDVAQDSVDSGSLQLRYVNAAASIEAYVPQGGSLSTGSVLITDSAGNQVAVEITDAVKTIGDLLLRINSASGINVSAELNDTGDGFVLIDEAGGSGQLSVGEIGGTTAAELRLLGSSVVGGDGKQRITSRLTTVIDVAATDTLDDIVKSINDAGGSVTASLIDDGSAFNATRLVLTSISSGSSGRFVIDDGGLGFSLNTLATGQDALLRVGADVRTGFLLSSSSNDFQNPGNGVDVEILATSDTAADVTVSRDNSQIENALQSFVSGFNNYVDTAKDLTKFDSETGQRGVLQGSSIVLRVTGRLGSLVNRQFFSSDKLVNSLLDLGIRIGAGGKLTFDSSRLSDALEADPQAVSDFFLTAERGFASLAEKTLDSFTDPLTGTFALEENALQSSVDSLGKRVAELDVLLERKRARLLRQFIQTEQILGQLVSQQQAISFISPLSIIPVGTGIF